MRSSRCCSLMSLLWFVCHLVACTGEKTTSTQSFLQVGEFAVHRISPDLTEVRDGAGRKLALIPRHLPAPPGYAPDQIVRVPVERVVAYGFFDVAVLRTLGVLDDVLIGVTHPEDEWYIEEVRRGLREHKIAYIGDPLYPDFEQIRERHTELVLTWDPAVIPMLSDLGIPAVVTTTPVAMCMNARMRYVQFLAPFFHREAEAAAFIQRVSNAVDEIKRRTAGSVHKPKVMWGDIYEKRVLVEPGNSWVAELIALARSEYLFEDVFGASCIEISLERFLYDGKDADILFTYRTPRDGVTSKRALGRLNPTLRDLRPLKEGKVFAPLPHFSQSGDHLDEILTEIAAIIHPDVYPGYQLRYFLELPEQEIESR